MNSVEITVILVNYKCDKKKLNQCLGSIKFNTNAIIIDHSHDFTLENVTVPKNINLEIVKNHNLGNGAGWNKGLSLSKSRYVLCLDIDTILPKNFYEEIILCIKKIKNFAVILPRINNHYKGYKLFGGLLWWQYLNNKILYNIKKKDVKKNIIDEVYTGSGSIMLIDKKNTIEENIKFDENIFLFFEENDFFHQCFKAKKKIFIMNNVRATHLDGSINDKSNTFECFKKWHWEWSKYYFYNKHYNFFIVLLIATKNLSYFVIKLLFFSILNKEKSEIYKSRLNGMISFYLKRKSFLRLK